MANTRPVHVDTDNGELRVPRDGDSVETPLKTAEKTTSEIQSLSPTNGQLYYDSDENRGVLGSVKQYLVGFRDVFIKRNSMEDLKGDTPKFWESLFSARPTRKLIGFYPDTEEGGGEFVWKPNEPHSNHNGGTIINPDHNSTIGSSGWYSSTGDSTDDTGSGCWVRPDEGVVNAKWFGAKGDNSNDDTESIRTAINYLGDSGLGGTLKFPSGRYRVTDTIVLDKSGIELRGSARHGTFYENTDGSYIAIADDISGAVFDVKNDENDERPFGCGIHNIAFVGDVDGINRKYSVESVVKLTATNKFNMSNIDFYSIDGRCIWSIHGILSDFQSININRSGNINKPCIHLDEDDSNGLYAQGNMFTGIRIEVCEGDYIKLEDNAKDNKFNGVGLEDRDDSSSGFTHTSGYFMNILGESNQFSNIHLNRTFGNQPKLKLSGNLNTLSGLSVAGKAVDDNIIIDGYRNSISDISIEDSASSSGEFYGIRIESFNNVLSNITAVRGGAIKLTSSSFENLINGLIHKNGEIETILDEGTRNEHVNVLSIDSTATVPIIDLKGDDITFQGEIYRATNASSGISLSGDRNKVFDSRFSEIDSGDGVVITNNSFDSVLENLFIERIGKNGIRSGDESNFYGSFRRISGCSIIDVGNLSDDTYDGISLRAPFSFGAVEGFINGNIVDEDSSVLRNGIYVSNNGSSARPDYRGYSVVNNIFFNTNGSTLIVGNDDMVIRDNEGFVTENSGFDTISSGNTSVTVSHGLDIEPSISNISVVAANDLGSATQFWIQNLTSSSFDIVVDVDPTENANFYWNIP